MTDKRMGIIQGTAIFKRTKFSLREARNMAQAHLGMRGFARRERGECQVGLLRAVADTEILGRGKSFRRAFEDAGVHFDIL